MTLYEFECPTCKKRVEELLSLKGRRKAIFCEECGAKMNQIISLSTPLIWKPLTLNHIADKPMTFNSKGDLRRYCRKHGLASAALL